MGGDNSKNRIEMRTLETESIAVNFFPNLKMVYQPKTGEWDCEKMNEDTAKLVENNLMQINQQKQDIDMKEKEKLFEKEKKKQMEKEKQQLKLKKLQDENLQQQTELDELKKDTLKLQIQCEIADQLFHDLELLDAKYKNYNYYHKEKIQDIEHKIQQQQMKQRLMEQQQEEKKSPSPGKSLGRSATKKQTKNFVFQQ